MYYNFAKYYKFFLPKNPIFIDVGANKGSWSSKILAKYNNAFVYAIEPLKDITSPQKNLLIFNYAIDRKNRTRIQFNVTRKNVTSSLLDQNRSIIKNFKTFKAKNGLIHKKSDYDIIKKIYVPTITLKKFCELKNIKEIHYLKIDAEGNDLNVLKSLGDNMIKNLWGFELETWNEKNTLWKKQLWLEDCLNFISKKNFTIVNKIIHGKGKTIDLICINKKFLKR
jgi:FkbM family methyltransferase